MIMNNNNFIRNNYYMCYHYKFLLLFQVSNMLYLSNNFSFAAYLFSIYYIYIIIRVNLSPQEKFCAGNF